ncbi:hypothetical protein LEP48_17780 [Isoptericola sp. NEAU-Y5]|uniref:LPXTG-motif cell wall anchor domain protein n=1 Tax=Isoptericola luteus TaxID=2879484 RepID=A0ABS7ZL08_9MICO|nr:hypothetical protein [Isoptericola sp. NEAU-Y5]MCA5895182.1 hypothetical protein [Isoptericola sp. NEAU-Y5]
MSKLRSRRSGGFAVLATVLALMATTAVTAQAAVTPATPVVPEPAVHDVAMRWTGEAGHLTVQGDALGIVTVVPGDAGATTVRVTNEGPSSGNLTASIVNASFGGADADDEFFRDLRINDVAAADLAGDDHVIHEVELAQGATTEVPLTYEFPLEATSGNRAEVGERKFAFDVQLRITGDPSATRDADPAPATPGGTGGADVGSTDTSDLRLAEVADKATGGGLWAGSTAATGGAALPTAGWMLFLAGGLLTLALAAARARRGVPAEQEDV